MIDAQTLLFFTKLFLYMGMIIGSVLSWFVMAVFLALLENRQKSRLISLLKNPEERKIFEAYFFPFRDFKISELWRFKK